MTDKFDLSAESARKFGIGKKRKSSYGLRTFSLSHNRKTRMVLRRLRRYRGGLFGLFLFFLLYAVLFCGILSAKKSAAHLLFSNTNDSEKTLLQSARLFDASAVGQDFALSSLFHFDKKETVEKTTDKSETVNAVSEKIPDEYAVTKTDSVKITVEAESIECPQNVLVYRTDRQTAVEYPLETYIVGVLLAEMPSNFHTEALRAQAIACRTYTVYKLFHAAAHADGAAICTDTGHCQSFVDPQNVSDERRATAESAVNDTAGLILCYDHEPILAAYHASGGRRTCSSAEAWGGTLSYLESVETYEAENDTLSATRVYEFSADEFSATLHTLCPTAPETIFDLRDAFQTVRSDSGRVTEISVGETSIAATDFVRTFGLRSRDFSLSFGNDTVTVTTYGYGHGVGLSQLGAEDLAQKGYTCEQILLHYYSGVTFGKLQRR